MNLGRFVREQEEIWGWVVATATAVAVGEGRLVV